jgi:hypothetical protein
MNRWLVEFDVRMAAEQYVSRRWDPSARAQYLLRQDILWPLSVDTHVWPSVFSFRDVKRPDMESYSTIEIDLAAGSGADFLRLDTVRAYYDAHTALAPGGVFVAVELLSEKDAEGDVIFYMLPGDIQCGVQLEQTIPDRLPAGSTLLGYDVADAGKISGLSNCEYTEDEINQLTPVWTPRLNSFGLLDTVENAVEFRHGCDERVPEHAPFWIYALWRLPIS